MDPQRIVVRADPEIKDLIPLFIKHRHEDIGRIRECLRQSDFETIEMLGHSMKGVGKGYGFAEITVLGGQIESAAKGRFAEAVENLVRELDTYLNCVDVIYE
ncbi:MAG: Hpt domain-containing protein [Candidatus Omnitrophica bacterium]|nr:Hpt domain-containing protein [Candidatus Omnitrophota bacterium]